MTSKTHVALGLLAGLTILQNNPNLSTYLVLSTVAIGSLIPDLDTKNSEPAQILPPIAWVVDKFTLHRHFTHMTLPLLLLLVYYYNNSLICWYFGIGATTHAVLDFVTKIFGITCQSDGEQMLFVIFWVGIVIISTNMIWQEYNLIQYMPDDVLENMKDLKTQILSLK